MTFLFHRKKTDDGDNNSEAYSSVTIGANTLHVEVVKTKEAIDKGLSGRDTLGASRGMLFVFDHTARFRFWMKGMRFPLDMIWIGEDMSIVHITANVPPAPLFSRPVFYSPPDAVRYVLEADAHFARTHGVKIGDSVAFTNI